MRLNPTQHRILKYIWEKRKTVRRNVSRDLDVNPSTVTRNLKDLIDEGVVRVYGTISTSSTVGRKSEVIGMNSHWRKIVGISIERGEIHSVLLTITGDVLREKRIFVEVNRENLVELLESVAGEFLDEVRSLAIAIPGVVSNGIVKYSVALSMKDVDLKSLLERRYGKKVYVVNDANAAAANFSERSGNLVCFLISIPYNLSEEVGIGAGILINGRLYTGTHDAAGEAGSGVKLENIGNTIEDLKSQRYSLDLVEDFIEKIGERISTLGQFVDPEIMVISGDVTLFSEEIREKLVKKIEENLIADIKIILDEEGGRSVARGAGMALINEAMNNMNVMIDYIL
jgi:predicted NBD/HSP70 family sugar kinase